MDKYQYMSIYTWVYFQFYEYLYILVNICLCSNNYICIYTKGILTFIRVYNFLNIINAKDTNKIEITF